jgi:hypothetical protein
VHVGRSPEVVSLELEAVESAEPEEYSVDVDAGTAGVSIRANAA